jgi:hypothetical protein
VDFVIEGDLVELHLSFKESFIMAPFPQAALVPDFCPGFGFDVEFSPVAADHDKPFDLDSQLGPDTASRGIMTNAAFDIFMGRCFPAFEVGFHEVAGSAKIRMRREFYRSQSDDNKESDKAQKIDESFFLFTHFLHSFFLNFSKKIRMNDCCGLHYHKSYEFSRITVKA